MHTNLNPVFEFHISREVRDFYGIDQKLFAQHGNVIFASIFAVRSLAANMNNKKDLAVYPERAIKAGQLNAMGLIDEILHYVVGQYKEKYGIHLFGEALEYLYNAIGQNEVEALLTKFTADFPPLNVYRNEVTVKAYLSGKTGKIANKEIVLEEIMLFHLANTNPAFSPFRELFDDTRISKETCYHNATKSLDTFFSGKPEFGPDDQHLVDMLRSPAVRFPNSLNAQLDFIRAHWGRLLSKYILRLLGGIDLINEESKPVFTGPGPTLLPDYARFGEEEYERFSDDLDWMPRVVMIAKSSYVWLDQLSKKYQRSITKLNEIPDEELDTLAVRGFTGLWLIGLWERSPASQKIKQINGNPEAVSSAYSLYDYAIANDLGGDSALNDLRNRAWKRGIRLASDMVPNHMGLYSRWMVEHPHWFIQNDHQLYPGYTFNGPNLSHDDRVGIYIEDGYWNRTDAAVIFKRVDHHTGEVRFIYHGNDGTSMPWNDTAQLNFLMAEVREAVIQTILHVARQFPIIRLDAAMTLAKKHFQRLWFPQPGSGGDIPTRSEFAISQQKFNELFPEEFWREVVDRVAREVPDTLLLAEAFWMMEGYFVRTLGMHRVYNSAFMNMLKNEDNQQYRQAIKDVMDFNPEIMKRYVNFMNNPDEETAVAQFGKDDKYFGVCILMATLPGLPMFGHGQVEGFTEKYGMEYRRAYWDEQEDQHLISRHEREIFPILKKRYLFSEVKNFILYDFHDQHGSVNENVFVFSNRSGEEKALVLFNNRYDRATGWIRYASATAGNQPDNSLSAGLALTDRHNDFTIFRDHISGLEYIRNNSELRDNGLFAELDGFKYHVFIDFRQVSDDDHHHYAQMASFLNGRGVPDIDTAIKETFLAPVHKALEDLLPKDISTILMAKKSAPKKELERQEQLTGAYKQLATEINNYYHLGADTEGIVPGFGNRIDALFKLRFPGRIFKTAPDKPAPSISNALESVHADLLVWYHWLLFDKLGSLQDQNYANLISLSWLDELLFDRVIKNSLTELEYEDPETGRHLQLLRTLIMHSSFVRDCLEDTQAAFAALVAGPESYRYLQINRYKGVLYLNRESLDRLLNNLFAVDLIISLAGKEKMAIITTEAGDAVDRINFILKIAEESGYQVEEILKRF